MKAVHLFVDIDMRLGHDGLFLVAKKAGIDIRTLSSANAVLFFNTNKTKVKAYSSNGLVSYARFDEGITPKALNVFADAVQTGLELEFNRETRINILKALGIKLKEEKRAA